MAASEITFKNPSSLFDPSSFGFSHVSIAEPSTRIIHLAGQVAIDAQGQITEGFDDQVRAVFTSIKACLAEAGVSLENVVNLTVYVVDYVVDYATNSNVMQLLGEELQGNKPPTAVISVPLLAIPGVKVEATAVAAVSASAGTRL